MTAFIIPGNLAQRLVEFANNSRGSMPTLPKVMVKSINVKVLHLGYRKKLNAIGATTARKTFFDSEELGGRVTVEVYFQKSESEKSFWAICTAVPALFCRGVKIVCRLFEF
jgi:hypothetical protein